MKKFIRIIALVLALLTLSGMAVSCANTGDPETTTEAPGAVSTTAPEVEQTEEETLYAPDDLPETMNFGETVTIYMWSNYTMMEFYAEESGDIIDDAIYKRNESVSNRLGIELDFVEEKGASGQMDSWIQKAENDYQSDNTFDMYSHYPYFLSESDLPVPDNITLPDTLYCYSDPYIHMPWLVNSPNGCVSLQSVHQFPSDNDL